MGYLTCRPVYLYHRISLSCAYNEKCFRRKLYINSKYTFYVQYNFFPESRAVYDKTWKNIVKPDMPHMTLWSMCIACCIPKDTNTPWEYVILTAFPLQQWLRERAWVLPYAYTAWYFYRRHGRAQMTYMCLSKLLMVTFHIVSTVLRVQRFCLYFMRGAVYEPRPGTRRYYSPVVFHALLEVLTPLCSRLGCESVFTWYSPVGVSKSTGRLKVKVPWDAEIWICHQFQWLSWRWKQKPVDTMSYS